MPEPPLEVVSLIRFSTAEQAAGLGRAGADGQRSVINIAAKYHGANVIQEYVINDVSGRHVMHDPQFLDMLEKLLRARGVLVAELSRLLRPDTFEDWAILAYFQRHKKFIITPTAILDPNTPEGRMAITMATMMSSEELHTIKGRFNRGKMIARLEKRHPGGNQALPRGYKFKKERNEQGKVIGFRWEVDPVQAARVQYATSLVLANKPFKVANDEAGVCGSGTALKRILQNPILIGIRRYEWQATGEERKFRKDGTPLKKPRRKLVRREVPLDVPTREELEAGALPTVRPIMDLATWDALQANIAAREGIVRKTRVKNEDKTRFLAMGILYCSCGEMMYFRYGSNGRSHLDRYYCKSQYPHGPGCGAPSIRRNELDPTIERLISERMLNVKFLTRILEAATAQAPVPDPVRIGIEQARTNLEAGRKDLLDMVRHHEITRKEFQEQIALLETELRQHQALLPAAPPAFNAREFLQRIANTFAVFSRLPFGAKREILSGAVKSIVADSRSRTLTSLTLSGGYLGRANEQLPSKTQLAIRPVPDLVIQLPEPFEIPDTYVDRRSGNGQHPNQIANRFRGRIQ